MHQPESLTVICCRFIGPRLHQVDSLAFVPEHLGLDMLQRFCSATAVEQLENRSCDPDNRLVSVCRLMDQAFSDSFCTCLCLDFIQVEPGSPLCNRLLLVLPLMRWLRRVSIRGVRLWDQHPLVPVIAANRRLRYLDVSHNDLTSEGVRTLTAPVRYKQTNQLAFLMLAGNRYLSPTCLKYLAQADSIKLVSLSDDLLSEKLCGKPDAAACCAEFRVKFAMCAAGGLPSAVECQCWATACGIVPRFFIIPCDHARYSEEVKSSRLFKRR